MLSENIRSARKSKGLSQEELAVKLNVVRQTVSKWEQGLSVPDSDMLISLSEALETPVSALLGENIARREADSADIEALSKKLEIINLQLARKKLAKIRVLRIICVSVFALTLAVLALLALISSPYLGWDFGDPETAVLGTFFHIFEWAFVRAAPLILIASAVGFILTYRRN